MVIQNFFIMPNETLSFFLMQFFVVLSLNDLQINNEMFACINKFIVGMMLAVDMYFSALALNSLFSVVQ